MSLSRRKFLKTGALATTGLVAANQLKADDAAKPEDVTVPKRKFGKHDDMLSVIGFGGHTLYLSGSQKEANEITDRALDLGVNFFENAWAYHGGRGEEYMGTALKGKRDKVFLMTKFNPYNNDVYGENTAAAMKMLEDSLRRLQTDYLDLWMIHNVMGNQGERSYQADGLNAAMVKAKEQGKIRYTGFTGHTTPSIHVQMIEDGFPYDSMLMPVSIVGALKSREFEEEVMPLCKKHEIAVLGMKGFGGSRRVNLHSKTNVKEVVRYALSYPEVCTHVIGVDKVEYVDQAVLASESTPMTAEERETFAVNARPGTKEYFDMMHGEEFYNDGSCSNKTRPA
ncbi:MAG: aldo/keto reductase [Verrucomicrobiota bacterium]